MRPAAGLLLAVLALVSSTASAGSGAIRRVALHPCTLGGVAARCGALSVPENRARPAGRHISLGFAVIPARPATGKEPLFYFAGGPGGSALSVAKFVSQVFRGTGRDLVLLDQRGVGASSPLLCPPLRPSFAIGDLRSYARNCVASLRADSRMYGTDAAMDDADALRAALGYPKVMLYGGSYGATAALVYIARHGSHVQAAILDGATSPDVPFFEQAPHAGQAQIDLLSAGCDANARCVKTYGHLAPNVSAVIRRLRAHPVTAPVEGGSVRFGSAEAGLTIETLSRDPATIPQLFTLTREAASGNLTPLTQAYARAIRPAIAATTRQVMYWRILCSEGWARQTPQSLASAAGSYLHDEAAAELQFRAAFCSALPRWAAGPDTRTPPSSAVPVLALVGGLDPQDPRRNVTPIARTLPNTTILTVPGAGHGSVQYGCLPAVAARFLDTRRITAGDRACAARVEAPALAQG